MVSPTSAIPDQDELLTALRSGRPEAFTRLYRLLHARVFNLAVHIVRDREDAADVTQEVFIKAFRQIPRHTGELRLEPWLYRITVNTCYDHLRRAATRTADSLDVVGDVSATGLDDFERAQLSAAVSSALSTLSPRYRAALVLKDVHGLHNAEIAEALGLSVGSAGVLLFRARRAFRRAFREDQPEHAGRFAALGLAPFLPLLPVPHSLQGGPDFAAMAAMGQAATVAAGAGVAATVGSAATVAGSGAGVLAGGAAATKAGGAAAAGLLAKVGAATATKLAIGAVGITTVVGGGLTVQMSTDGGRVAGPTSGGAAAAAVGSGTAAGTAHQDPAGEHAPTADREPGRQRAAAAGQHAAALRKQSAEKEHGKGLGNGADGAPAVGKSTGSTAGGTAQTAKASRGVDHASAKAQDVRAAGQPEKQPGGNGQSADRKADGGSPASGQKSSLETAPF